MARRRKYAPVERLRWLLLAAFVVLVAAVAALYLRRDDSSVDPLPAARRVFGGDESDEVVLAGEGFEYEQTDGARRVFRLEASRIVSDSQGLVVLEDVRVEFDREDGGKVFAISDRAVYRYESSVARLEGHVKVRRGGELELRTDKLELTEDGDTLVSDSPVQFGLGEQYRGRADKLEYHLGRNRLRLQGAVQIDSLAGGEERGRLTCNELIVERDARLVRAEGAVTVRRGDNQLQARRVSLTFAEDEKTLEFARAYWDVRGQVRQASGADLGSWTRFRAHQLSLTFRDGQYEKFELEGFRELVADLATEDDAGLERRIRAPYLIGDFVRGRLDIVRGYDGVTIGEGLRFADLLLRRACAEWVVASFDVRGEIDEMVLQNRVDYQEAGLQALGDRVRVAGRGPRGEATLTGGPAELRSERGVVIAPRIAYAAGSAVVTAGGGVRAELPPRGGFGLIGQSSSESVRLTSNSAEWNDPDSSFSFAGSVRAWQGEDYLLADRLDGEQAGDRLKASGRVKSVVRPKDEEGRPADEEGADRRRGPIEVTADSLVYHRAGRLLTYSGSVRAHEVGRTLRCSTLDALLGEDDRFERLTCKGETVLENPEGGQTVRGDEAVYEPADGQIRITGNPAVMRNRDGVELRGAVVIYDVETGTARVQSLPRPASEGDPVP